MIRPAVARALSAALLLALFWGALAWDFRFEIGSALLQVGRAPRGGHESVPSVYLDVDDRSSAGEALVHETVARLEADCKAIRSLWDPGTEAQIPVSIVDGSGPAMTDGRQLNLYHYQGQIDLSTAPFFLVLLGEGDLAVYDVRLFVEGGFAVYVSEEIGRALPLLGQSADAWVRWWRQQGTWVPLAEAWQAELPTSERQVPAALRAAIEGASLIRWVAQTYGLDAVQELRTGMSLSEVTGLSPAEAELAWLDDLEKRPIQPRSCAAAVPTSSLLHAYCPDLDRVAGN